MFIPLREVNLTGRTYILRVTSRHLCLIIGRLLEK